MSSSDISLLLHRNHLHQNTTVGHREYTLFDCCTEIICIKTQPRIALGGSGRHCCTEIICIKTQLRDQGGAKQGTVAQKSFASKHNIQPSAGSISSLLHRNHLHQNTTRSDCRRQCLHCCTEIICIFSNNYSRYPVFTDKDSDQVTGILYIKDLLPYLREPQGFR